MIQQANLNRRKSKILMNRTIRVRLRQFLFILNRIFAGNLADALVCSAEWFWRTTIGILQFNSIFLMRKLLSPNLKVFILSARRRTYKFYFILNFGIGMIIKPPKLLKPENNGDEKNKIDILSIGYNGMQSMEKKLCSKVLVHGYF